MERQNSKTPERVKVALAEVRSTRRGEHAHHLAVEMQLDAAERLDADQQREKVA